MSKMRVRGLHVALLVVFLAVFVWSAVKPRDLQTWCLELGPIVVGMILLVVTYRKFPFTTLTYVWICLSAIIVAVGGHYSYAHNPWFQWLGEKFGWERNYYDRFGHCVKGLVALLIAREILVRKSPVRDTHPKWLVFLALNLVMSSAGVYELLEFTVAKITGTGAQEFLATQGDVWDTQWDMTMALLGAVIGLVAFSKWQDRQMLRLPIDKS
ncbi:DUF2238 domain-containing protein [Tumebacillus sp. ITR2]|uniref:DUF2238 domain-containing protein n=1 Tax=Tumebacillus amylolyticus TaxID=2801339 RepID=A0ABS1JAL6_9BACL|nr:DUF2238 domain-containing protein [Tumebacillus amylolyticus]MBL0387215.1 DUF2238 domain-containing protein [Tumebacillus amylolyticus]